MQKPATLLCLRLNVAEHPMCLSNDAQTQYLDCENGEDSAEGLGLAGFSIHLDVAQDRFLQVVLLRNVFLKQLAHLKKHGKRVLVQMLNILKLIFKLC